MFWIFAYPLSLYILFITFKLHFKEKINAFELKLMMPIAVLFSLPIYAISSIAVDMLQLTGFAIIAVVTAGSFLSSFTLTFAYIRAQKDMKNSEVVDSESK